MRLGEGIDRSPSIDRSRLIALEANFISPDIYRRDDVAERQVKLAHVVSAEIVPRLLHLHNQVPASNPLLPYVAGDSDISSLAQLVLGADLAAAAAYIAGLRDSGLAMESLFLGLLEPTAHHLGALWDEDVCDFIDVTLGVARLQKLLAIFNCTHEIPALNEKRRVMMATTPGDQHYFGVAMVEKFLVAGGWDVHAEHGASAETLAVLAATQWFAVAGLTLGSEALEGSLRGAIELIRRRSLNPAIGIMVGGPIFKDQPERVRECGADATAANAPAAVLVAQKLFDAGALKQSASSLD